MVFGFIGAVPLKGVGSCPGLSGIGGAALISGGMRSSQVIFDREKRVT